MLVDKPCVCLYILFVQLACVCVYISACCSSIFNIAITNILAVREGIFTEWRAPCCGLGFLQGHEKSKSYFCFHRSSK